MAENFEPINTQEEFDAAISARIERERKKYEGFLSPEEVEEKYNGYLSPDEVKAQYDGYLSPDAVEEKFKGFISPDEAAEKDRQIKEYETSSVKMRIALETGLPADLADRLQGADEEALRADAAKLAGYANKQQLPQYEPEPATDTKKDPDRAKYAKMLESMKGE